LEVNLVYIVIPCLKKKKEMKERREERKEERKEGKN
jgi:hypothetical protein